MHHPLTSNCSALISDLKLNVTVLSLTATLTGLQPCQRTGDMCIEEVLRKARRLNHCLFHQPKQGFRLSALQENIVLRWPLSIIFDCLFFSNNTLRISCAFTTTSPCDSQAVLHQGITKNPELLHPGLCAP